MRSSGAGSILEAFKPGTAPPDSYAAGDSDSPHVLNVSPDIEKAVGSGTGGLY
jgi:penicillin-binding protein 1A